MELSLETRFGELKAAVEAASRQNRNQYDCVLHLTGSRENALQLHLLRRVLGLRPLTVTFNHLQYSDTERWHRLQLLEKFDVDNLVFNARESIIGRLAQEKKFGGRPAFAHAGAAWLSFVASRGYGIPTIVLDESFPFPAASPGIAPLSDSLVAYWQREIGLAETSAFKGLDLKPYRFQKAVPPGTVNVVHLSKISPFTPADYERLEKEFPWANDAEVKRRLEEEENKARKPEWAAQPGKKPTTWERNPKRAKTVFEDLSVHSEQGLPLFHKTLRYCVRCCMPETAEALAFDEMGMCPPCRSSEQKMHIDWSKREQKLRDILESHRSKDESTWDAMIPISGGKDSTFQVWALTQKYKIKPLAVTFSHNWFTPTGKKNLENAYRRFDIDHVMMIPRRGVVNKLARKSLGAIGDSCWHCHAGVGSFPLQVAVRFGVGLLIYGESVAESHTVATYETPILYDRDYFTKVSARLYAEQMVDQDISLFDVQPYVLPSHEEIADNGVSGIHLGNYIFWDDERQTEFVRDFCGWIEDAVEGAYKGYKSVECRMAGVHDYAKFIKRGFGRGTDQASLDVRNGLLTREQGFDLAKRYDAERPEALDYYLEITGYTEKEFERVLRDLRGGKAKELP